MSRVSVRGVAKQVYSAEESVSLALKVPLSLKDYKDGQVSLLQPSNPSPGA